MSRLWAYAMVLASALTGSGPLAANVEVVSPKPGAELSGKVEVVATVTTPKDAQLDRVILQGVLGEAIEMKPGRQNGTYTAVLDTTKLPNGKQALMVIQSVKGKDKGRTEHADDSWESPFRIYDAEVEVKVGNPYQVYFGDLHAHTSYSDGVGLPKDAYAFARDKSRLDFMCVTDHSQIVTLEEYADVMAQANRANKPGTFVALYGAESTESTGHMNFFMAPTSRIPPTRDEAYEAIGSMKVLGQFNHPGVKSDPQQGWKDDYEGFHYSPVADRSMALAEVRTASEEEAYIALLNAGWHVGAAANDDTHGATWGSENWTAVLARELTREGIMEALWARRSYSAGDRNVKLTFTLDGEDMGAQITRPAGTYHAAIAVADPEAADTVEDISLFLDGKIVSTAQPKLAKCILTMPVELTAGRHYVFVRLTQAGDHMTWSSPVWISAY